jgi:hypothetical protein
MLFTPQNHVDYKTWVVKLNFHVPFISNNSKRLPVCCTSSTMRRCWWWTFWAFVTLNTKIPQFCLYLYVNCEHSKCVYFWDTLYICMGPFVFDLPYHIWTAQRHFYLHLDNSSAANLHYSTEIFRSRLVRFPALLCSLRGSCCVVITVVLQVKGVGQTNYRYWSSAHEHIPSFTSPRPLCGVVNASRVVTAHQSSSTPIYPPYDEMAVQVSGIMFQKHG